VWHGLRRLADQRALSRINTGRSTSRYRVAKRVQIGTSNGRSHEALQLFPVDNQVDFFGQISRNVAKPSFEDRHNVLVRRLASRFASRLASRLASLLGEQFSVLFHHKFVN
jgi:hypothetical protein